MRDITEQHRVEAMRRDFVANVSHEIRTPLTVISGFIDTLIDLDLSHDQVLEYLHAARKQSATMERLLVDLLTLSALESTAASAADAFELRPLLEAQVADARALSAGRHRIVLEADADVGLTGVAAEVETAVRNLLTNAIRYTSDQGSITVRLAVDPQTGGARLSVADSGIGIAAEHLPRLTERFYRVDRGRSRDSGGTGLGLAIVKHVAQRHQAGLEIDSTPGRGSCFALVFPPRQVTVASAKAGVPISRPPAPPASGTP
jgi:two-component system phosphate regulon sensor histidine kinase PhoR